MALDLSSIYYVNAGHGTFRISRFMECFEFESVLAMYNGFIPTNTICYKNCIVNVQWLIYSSCQGLRQSHLQLFLT